MTVVMVTSASALILTSASYFVYEFVSFRRSTVTELSTLGKIIAANSTAALAFNIPEDANEIISAVRANPHIVGAALYDERGRLFTHYPPELTAGDFPDAPGEPGYRFEESFLAGFEPVVQGNQHLGTLFLKSDLDALTDRLILFSSTGILVAVMALIATYLVSQQLQRQITVPITSLAGAAIHVSAEQDYSIRAKKHGNDEIGALTDAFNYMLARIEEQNLELSESESRVRAMIDSALSAVIVIDSDGLVTDWNSRAEKIFGWTKEEMLGRTLTDTIIPPQYRNGHEQGIKSYLSSGQGKIINHLIEFSALRSDGSEFPVELFISPIKIHSRQSFCGFITDITERKRAEFEIKSFNMRLEQKVAERTQELEAANKELEAFSYSVSHDLRAPLRSVHGYMNIFSEEYSNKLDDEGRRLINVIIRNGQIMGQLIDDLLAFSHLGRRELICSIVSMKPLVETIIEDQKRMDPRREVDIRVADLPDAFADPTTIRQVWSNLISNAFKYTARKEKAIIEIGYEDKGDEVVYFIRDNGAGFNMDYYSKLFGVFQRLHSARDFEGTGVGLAIVQRIILKHGGTVWAEGKQNEGATFYFSLRKEIPNS